MEDDILKEFINESREHLFTIEADLLTIEEGGADIDEDLVNKVFRAAHSIKGGSGFFGLSRVKELAHKAETVLDMLRSRRMAPNPEIINVLLNAFDKLRDMINNANESESADITDLVATLTALATSYLPGDKKATLSENVELPLPGGGSVTLARTDFDRVRRSAQFIYRLSYDLIHDIERKGKSILDLFRDLGETGEVLDCIVDFEAAGTLDGTVGNALPLTMIFACVMDPDLIDGVIAIAPENVKVLYSPAAATSTPTPLPAPPPPAAAVTPVQAPPEPAPGAAEPRATAESKPSTDHKVTADDTLRVNVGLLETLMNLAGELVLGRNQLHAAISNNNAETLAAADGRLNQVTAELQDAIMRTRLQPIGNVFAKFPRVVRDMAAALHKEIDLEIEGKDVALDRSLIEGLSDPLTHMIRNAVDHGIETPDERKRHGKKPVGTVRIEARHEAGQVVVEIADDGKGIDGRRIAEAALKKGLIRPEKLQGMSDQDKIALIFLPGLSTAEKVTDISGRGVGMDVVKTNLDRLGGKVEIKSEIGKGSLFRIKLPLTLAIIPSLIVSVENEKFAIPQINVEELLRIRPEEVKHRIEVVGDAEVLLLRDRIIPLVRYSDLLGMVTTYVNPETRTAEIDRRTSIADRRSPRQSLDAVAEMHAGKGSPGRGFRGHADRRVAPANALEIVVVTTGTMQYGLVVGAFHNTEEIVVKPLGRHLKMLREYAGATILGDGTVVLIIDIGGLANKADLATVSGSARAVKQAEAAALEKFEDVHSLLLFHNAEDEVCAMPLDTVMRVERAAPSQIETAGNRRTIQYRGVSLPLVTLADAAQVKPLGDTKDLAVIVSSVHGREVGLLGAMPVDVIEIKAQIDQVTHRQKGISGSAIIREKTTLLADVYELVDAIYPEWGQERIIERQETAASAVEAAATAGAETGGSPSDANTAVLLAEDSDFFRSQVKRYLEGAGYTVFDAPDGEAAWELLQQHVDEIKVVVTDIEMPRLDGIGLTKRIRADSRTAALPVIAVTSLAGDEEVAKGKAAGVTAYHIKLDRDRLIEAVGAIAAAA
jgi:two-component system chemotaxis sensor kinase CheA